MQLKTAFLTGLALVSTASAAIFTIAADPDGFEPVQMAQAQPAQPTQFINGKPGRVTPAHGSYASPFLPPTPAVTPARSDWSSRGAAQPSGSKACEEAIMKAETRYGLPPFILQAIAITESGQGGKPSPWAMNIKGKSHYAQGRAEVEAIVAHHGARASIDIGCNQINLRWHGSKFDDWRQLLDPEINADYAARYLRELRQETGSWGKAVAAYHSRTNWRGAGYACTVSRNYGRLLGDKRKGCGPNIDQLTAYLSERKKA